MTLLASILMLLQLSVGLLTSAQANPNITAEQRDYAIQFANTATNLALEALKNNPTLLQDQVQPVIQNPQFPVIVPVQPVLGIGTITTITEPQVITPQEVKDIGVSFCQPDMSTDKVQIKFWCSYVRSYGGAVVDDVKIEITMNGITQTTGPGKLENLDFQVTHIPYQKYQWTIKMTKGNQFVILNGEHSFD